ncbi:MAG: CBS domain-containing protein [Alphaproteobacteria bacterium]|jgi:CBS domain containing-hemolysin-like protein|nr:CBS domain-containing protein [Alphaproteobacteria bacterium]
MTDNGPTRRPRTNGADDTPSTQSHGLFRTWLRGLRGKTESSWRDTIEELIEERDEPEPSMQLHERMLLRNILRLQDTTAIDVMVPRADIVAVDISTSLPEVLRVLSEKAHSRVPVYRETLDDVVGMVHIRDVLSVRSPGAAGDGEDEDAAGATCLRDILRDILIVAPSMPVLDMLLEMRQRRQHMALVVDEFGGIDGLITIEDLIEEIVGEIQDEHEIDETPRLDERPDGTFLADARLPIEDFEKRVTPVLEDNERDDIDTLGGLVFTIAGRVPARGELLRHKSGLEFEVIDADSRRIKRLRVRRVAQEEQQTESA